jgi:hypothetical protein
MLLNFAQTLETGAFKIVPPPPPYFAPRGNGVKRLTSLDNRLALSFLTGRKPC